MRLILRDWRKAYARLGNSLPDLTDLNQELLERFWADSILLRVIDSGGNYHYLHHGVNIALHFGQNMTGSHVSKLPISISQHYFELLGSILNEKVPVYCRATAASMVAVEYWDRLVLPFSAAGSNVDRVLLLSYPRAWRISPDQHLNLVRNLNHLDHGICVVNGNKEVTLWNRTFLEFFDIDLSQIYLKINFDVLNEIATFPIEIQAPSESTEHALTYNIAGAPEPHASMWTQNAGNRILLMEVASLPDTGMIITASDFTLTYQLQADLQASKGKLEEVVRDRTLQLSKTILELERQSAQQKRLEQELSDQKLRLEVTLEAIVDGVISTDEFGRIIFINLSAERLLSTNADMAKGCAVVDILTLTHAEDNHSLDLGIQKCLEDGQATRFGKDAVLNRMGDRGINVSVTLSPIKDKNNHINGVVITLTDITESRRQEKEILFAAHHDELTGLSNRKAIYIALDRSLARADNADLAYGLLYLDIDQFKNINDEGGHLFGDQYLIQVAEILKSNIRLNDLAGRLGGDEFVVLLENCNSHKTRYVAEKIRKDIEAISVNFDISPNKGTVSIGCTNIKRPATNKELHLKRADQALYQAKQNGGNSVFFWQTSGGKNTDSYR
ncbi:MAG: diguanylate cyclase (GGDEF)-like protein/PAS domain S-box-containing protein [Parasphingorhabdus sp.]|jgi:diguanylate cyclase (GGDEF)-like protein/PAS domain S-box-containing protein